MTHDQIAQCQDAGNSAYDAALKSGASVTRCSDAYYAAYQHEQYVIEHYTPHAVNTLDDIVPIADAMMQEYASTMRENVKDWNDIKGDCDL